MDAGLLRMASAVWGSGHANERRKPDWATMGPPGTLPVSVVLQGDERIRFARERATHHEADGLRFVWTKPQPGDLPRLRYTKDLRVERRRIFSIFV